MKDLKVALVHDYLREYGGAERVLEELHEIFPEAPIYTAFLNSEGLGAHSERIKGWNIQTSWLQYAPFANYLVSPFRVLAPKIFESFDLSGYDVVISSCNVYFAKAVLTKPKTLHVSYIHTPPRYLYGYTTSFNYKKHWWTHVAGEVANHFLRIADFKVSQRPNILVANSKNVAERIKKFYRRDSVVIYPPITLPVIANKFTLSLPKGSNLDNKKYFLSVGRLVKGKGIEKIIKACMELGLPLKVAGTGSELKTLQKLLDREHNEHINFLGQVDDKDLPALYAGAIATIVASEDEDFGIVPVESQSCGTPVIAIRQGGFLETVVEGKTGEFFTEGNLEKVLQKFLSKGQPASGWNPKKYQPEDCIKQAQKFSKERFKKEILDLINKNFPVK